MGRFYFDPDICGFPDEKGFEAFFKSGQGKELMKEINKKYTSKLSSDGKSNKKGAKGYAHRGFTKGFDPSMYTGRTDEENLEIAKELAERLDNAFNQAQRNIGEFGGSPSRRFKSGVKVHKTISNKTYFNVKIEYSEQYLSRESLTVSKEDNTRIGSGLYDIYGYFVNYDRSNQKYVKGWWEEANSFVQITNKQTMFDELKRDFVVKVIEDFVALYPEVEVTIPSEWSTTGVTQFGNS